MKRQAEYLQQQAKHAATMFQVMHDDTEHVFTAINNSTDLSIYKPKPITSHVVSKKTVQNQLVFGSTNIQPPPDTKKPLCTGDNPQIDSNCTGEVKGIGETCFSDT